MGGWLKVDDAVAEGDEQGVDISLTLEVFHLEISGNDDNELQLKNI